MSIIKLSQLETILNYALQFRLQTKSNKFCRKWWYAYRSSSYIWDRKSFDKSFVFIDESEFEDNQDCIYAWSKKGKKVYGEQEGKRGKRENLVAGRRKKEKDLIAPIIFKVTLNAVGFEKWLAQHLLP